MEGDRAREHERFKVKRARRKERQKMEEADLQCGGAVGEGEGEDGGREDERGWERERG